MTIFFHESSHLNIYLGMQLNGARRIYGFSQKKIKILKYSVNNVVATALQNCWAS